MLLLFRLRTLVVLLIILGAAAGTAFKMTQPQIWMYVWIVFLLVWPMLWSLLAVRHVRRQVAAGRMVALRRGPRPAWKRYLIIFWLILAVTLLSLFAADLLDRFVVMLMGALFALLQMQALMEMYFPDVFRCWLLDETGIASASLARNSGYVCKWVSVKQARYDEASSELKLQLRSGEGLAVSVMRGQPAEAALARFFRHAGAATSHQL